MEQLLGSKLPIKYQDPVDNAFDQLVVRLNPVFKSLNFTPNDITTLSVIFGLLTIHFLNKSKGIIAGICYLISYYFDCQDGNYARTYKMYTDFGDLYDHASDIIVFGGLLYIVITRMKKEYLNYFVLFGTIFGILSLLHFTKRERYHKATPDERKEMDMKSMEFLRFFGIGIFVLVTSVLMMFSDKLLVVR